MKKRTYIYRSFERFWHWSQALLIFFLALTGFEVHGSFQIFGFSQVVVWHNIASWALIVLIIFAIFWHFVTGEWKQYIPTTKYVKEQIAYYLAGIFKGAEHPTHKTRYNKFNPLQRLIYLGLKLLVIPVQVVTGLMYMIYIYPKETVHVDGIHGIALIHTFGASILIAFVIAHVYLTTTSKEPLASIKAMITGWEDVHIDENEDHALLLQDAVENSTAGYYRITKEGTIIDVNQAWLDLYKCKDRKKIIGSHYSITRAQNDLTILDKIVQKVLSGESVSGLEVTRKCYDGTSGQHILTANPTFEDNVTTGMEGFIIDTTNLKPVD